MHYPVVPAIGLAIFTMALAQPATVLAEAHDGSVTVAQSNVGVFVDSKGRRVYYDKQTNRIIAIEERDPVGSLLDQILPPIIGRAPYPPEPEDQGIDTYPPAPPPPEGAPPPSRVDRAPLDPPGFDPRFEQPGDAPARADAPQDLPPPSDARPAPAAPDSQLAGIPPRTDPLMSADPNLVADLQVLLDREGFSPGVIDGRMGGNVRKALEVARDHDGLQFDLTDPIGIEAALDRTGGPAFTEYVITPQDVAGPFVASIPEDYAEKARLPAMSYTSPAEMLAERFHMAQSFLQSLNPGADFYRAGTVIRVAATGGNADRPVVRIEADKAREQVRAYDASGGLVAAYPATIGSSDTPSPSGTVQVDRIAFDPNYTYNPKVNFVQGDNLGVLTIPPGPNGPVGSIWIALSKPTYGIHGTPEPDRIGKTNSHGCVRLTNWDAAELAKLVTRGVTVEFLD